MVGTPLLLSWWCLGVVVHVHSCGYDDRVDGGVHSLEPEKLEYLFLIVCYNYKPGLTVLASFIIYFQ